MGQKLKSDNTMISEEIWKTIAGIQTHQVSNFGRVRSLPRKSIVIGKRHYVRDLPGKMLSLCESQRYTTVSINDHTYTVHRLVAEAFIPNKSGKPHVNHINGNKHDNRACNLEWATISENELHSYCCLGKRPWNYGKHYDTTKAVKTRRENYYKKCESTLQEFQKSKQSVALFSASVGLSSRQVYERLRVAKAIRKEVRYE